MEKFADNPPPGAAPDWTIPQDWASYTPQEHATWDALFARQARMLPGRVAPAFLEGLEVLRSSADSAVGGRLLVAFLSRMVFTPLLRSRRIDHATARIELACAQLGGVAVLRYVTRMEPVASMDLEDLVAMLGPSVHLTLTSPYAGRASRVTRFAGSQQPGGRPGASPVPVNPKGPCDSYSRGPFTFLRADWGAWPTAPTSPSSSTCSRTPRAGGTGRRGRRR